MSQASGIIIFLKETAINRAVYEQLSCIVVLKYMHTVFVKLHTNGRNNLQQCWELLANNVASGCLHGALDIKQPLTRPQSSLFGSHACPKRARKSDGKEENKRERVSLLSSFPAPLALPLSAPLSLILIAD